MNDTMHDPHLVPLDPSGWTHVRCPACGSSDVDTSGVVTPGIHMMGDHSCRSCGYEFLLDLPVGFGVQHPMAIGRSDGRLHNPGDGGLGSMDLSWKDSGPRTIAPFVSSGSCTANVVRWCS